LWPSAEAEAPKASLEVALARLRKLLDVPGAVLLADGGLRLDPRMVWSDVAAFETLEQRWQAGGHGAPGERDSAAAQRAITLYRGALLAGEPLAAAPWQLLREQMGRRYTRLVVGYGAALELQSRWREAAEVYEQALARDVLAEPLYRALMRAQLQLGERAEALRTYARCRELLATVLGVTPAHETRLLREQAAGGSS
jgi:DNA-binding SARP family transcriptional activator